jgi:hypothetical protein
MAGCLWVLHIPVVVLMVLKNVLVKIKDIMIIIAVAQNIKLLVIIIQLLKPM